MAPSLVDWQAASTLWTRLAANCQWGEAMTRLEFIQQLEEARDNLTDTEKKAALYNNISLFEWMSDEEWNDSEQAARAGAPRCQRA